MAVTYFKNQQNFQKNVSVSGLKIVPDFILQKVTNARKRGLKIVLVTGVFDLLHQEHVIFLAKAKSGGDLLIVAIESDMRVKKIKGNDRPIQGQADRFGVEQIWAFKGGDSGRRTGGVRGNEHQGPKEGIHRGVLPRGGAGRICRHAASLRKVFRLFGIGVTSQALGGRS